MKEFTTEMLNTLHAANDATRGTADYLKYHMQCDFKHNGKWKFAGWTIPYTAGTIKTVRGKTYIIAEYVGLYERHPERFEVNDAVKELLGIE